MDPRNDTLNPAHEEADSAPPSDDSSSSVLRPSVFAKMQQKAKGRRGLIHLYLLLVWVPNVIVLFWCAHLYAQGDMTMLWTLGHTKYPYAAARNPVNASLFNASVAAKACGGLVQPKQFFLSTRRELTSELLEGGSYLLLQELSADRRP